MKYISGILFTMLSASSASAAVIVDDFESGNPHKWTFSVTNPDSLKPSGGNPRSYLLNTLVIRHAPRVLSHPDLHTPLGVALATASVSRIAVDAITHATSIPRSGAFALVLRATNGTPHVKDDDFAYTLADREVPRVGEGWVSYSFDVPSGSTDATPRGWNGGNHFDHGRWREGMSWPRFIHQVDQVEFWWIDPRQLGIVHDSMVGIDNVRVEISDPARETADGTDGAGGADY